MDDALDVLRQVWSAQGQTSADLDEACGTTKSCKKMADVGFDGHGRGRWRPARRVAGHAAARGQAEPEAGSVRDLVLGSAEARR